MLTFSKRTKQARSVDDCRTKTDTHYNSFFSQAYCVVDIRNEDTSKSVGLHSIRLIVSMRDLEQKHIMFTHQSCLGDPQRNCCHFFLSFFALYGCTASFSDLCPQLHHPNVFITVFTLSPSQHSHKSLPAHLLLYVCNLHICFRLHLFLPLSLVCIVWVSDSNMFLLNRRSHSLTVRWSSLMQFAQGKVKALSPCVVL